jgi:hypothetical protein
MRLAALALMLAGLQVSPAAAADSTRPVPATIDATGRTDVTRPLQRFVDSVPNGSTVLFRRAATYRVDGTLEFRHRRGITLDGNGARLVARTPGNAYRAHVRLVDGRDWTIRRLTVQGANPVGGQFDPGHQWQHGFDLRGVDGARLEDVTVTDVFGDDIYVGLSTTRPRWSRDISIVDSVGTRSGRMAIAIVAGRRVTVEGGIWSEPGLSTFDIEPNGRPGGADRILIENTTIGAGSRHRALDITGRGPVSNVTLRHNVLTGRALHVRADQGRERPRNIVVQGNTSEVEFAGPGPAAMIFRNTDGVTVSGNTQRLQRGRGLAMVATQGSTRVAVSERPYRELPADSRRVRYITLGSAIALVLVVVHRFVFRRRSKKRGGRLVG